MAKIFNCLEDMRPRVGLQPIIKFLVLSVLWLWLTVPGIVSAQVPGQVVDIPDANLAAAVRNALNLPPNAPLTEAAMQTLIRLEYRGEGLSPDKKITHLTGLEYAINLGGLDLREHQISDLVPLQNLTNLTWLRLWKNQIIDVSPLQNLTNLKELLLDENQITDVSPLQNLTNLSWLLIGGNDPSIDITPLQNLTNLRGLSLYRNQITDVLPLQNLTNLTRLWLEENQITDVSPLVGLVNLELLRLAGNPFSDTSPLAELLAQNPELDLDIDPALPRPWKITGPWLWMIAPTEAGQGGANSTDVDSLADVSGGAVTETVVAINGAAEGEPVGSFVWTLGDIAATGRNNINALVNRIGFAQGNVDDHSAYALITLESATVQSDVTMRVGSDDSIKVWLNGEVVHKKAIGRGAVDYQDSFAVDLGAGDNLLLVKVSERGNTWSMFVGIDAEVTAIYKPLIVEEPLPYVYWIDSGTDKIQGADYDGSNVQDIVTTGLRTPTGIAVDLPEGKVYWIDSGTDTIQRANLDGSNIEDIATGLRTPTGIAVDTFSGILYWIDSGTDTIERVKLDGSSAPGIVVTTGLKTPTDIALDPYDPNLGKMYWTDSGTDTIQRANLDGSNIQDLVTTGLRTPTSIALDLDAGKMYWTDSGTDKIQRANLDGSNIEDIVTTGLRTPTGIAVDPEAGKMYWVDSGTDTVQRANLDGSNIEDIVTTGLKTPTSIALNIPQIASSDPPPEPPGLDDPVDVNGDGQVTVVDLAIVAIFYGTQVPDGANIPADVNSDGTVDLADLTAVAEAIDAAGNGGELSADDVAAVLEAIADIEGIPEAPNALSGGNRAYHNVAAALADARLDKRIPETVLKVLLHLFSESVAIPETTALLPNYPNPFNPETWIPYELAESADVTVHIYSVKGDLIRTLALGHQPVGIYQAKSRAAYWDGKNAEGERVASGVYFYTLTAGEFAATRKMLIRK